MITELRIRGLGVIADAVVPFAPGLTVVTGETGAGKTMVLTGLGLVSGERADPGLVRTGSERADVDAEWRLGPATLRTLASRLEDAGVDLEAEGDDQVLLLGRTVAAGGRSRAFAGGRSVPATVLAELSTTLLTVHGQADQLSLRDPRRQRDLLDAFAGAGPDKDRFAEAFARWRSAGAALRGLLGLFALPQTAGVVAYAAVGYAAFITLRGLWLGPMLVQRFDLSLLQAGHVALAMTLGSMASAARPRIRLNRVRRIIKRNSLEVQRGADWAGAALDRVLTTEDSIPAWAS